MEGTLLLQEKFFNILKSYEQKFRKFFNHFFFTLNPSYFSNHTTYAPNFFHQKYYIVFFRFWHTIFSSLNWNFLKIVQNFLKIKNSNTYMTALAMFWMGNPCYMISACVALLAAWRRYYKDRTPCIVNVQDFPSPLPQQDRASLLILHNSSCF